VIGLPLNHAQLTTLLARASWDCGESIRNSSATDFKRASKPDRVTTISERLQADHSRCLAITTMSADVLPPTTPYSIEGKSQQTIRQSDTPLKNIVTSFLELKNTERITAKREVIQGGGEG